MGQRGSNRDCYLRCTN
uniref:Uncharacterized protein n=1 Tax=Arundo donax TaxID=35708 RepID=A0A0A9BZF8_ARUDO